MINGLFLSDFYSIFHAPNSDELIEFCNKKSKLDVRNDLFSWGKNCVVDKILLKWEDLIDLYQPSLEIFSQQLDKKFNYTMFNPWLNLYEKDFYQEIHCHKGYDISSIFFVNDGVDFSELFFYDRNATDFSDNFEELISFESTVNISYKRGDIIFFPSHTLHGVTSHQSNEIRKTLSVNLKIDKVK